MTEEKNQINKNNQLKEVPIRGSKVIGRLPYDNLK